MVFWATVELTTGNSQMNGVPVYLIEIHILIEVLNTMTYRTIKRIEAQP